MAENEEEWQGRFHQPHGLLKQAQRLDEEDNEAEALEHRADPERLIAEMAEWTDRGRREEEGRRHLEELHQRAQRMADDIEELRRAGRYEQTEKVERERAELEEHIHKLSQRRELLDPERLEEPERRLHHLRIAAENLQAAEMPGLAEKVEREAEKLEQRLDRQHPRLQPHLGQLLETIERLNEDVRQLHREIEHLHEHLRQLSKERD